jgi:general secretion pathway protein K
MALLLVISVISLLTVIIVQFNQSSSLALVAAVQHQERELLEAAVQSGVDIGCALLHADRQGGQVDSLVEPWALVDVEPLPIFSGETEVRLRIVDLAGLLPINHLVTTAGGGNPEWLREALLRLLLSGRFALRDEAQAQEIVDSLVDWLDTDDNELPYGAETAYYQSLQPPYEAANRPFLMVGELLLVKGITGELLYGTDEKEPLADYISVGGNGGRININTVPLPVLLALDERLEEETAILLDEFRRDKENESLLGDPSWYRAVPGWPDDITFDPQLVSTGSRAFRVVTEARYRDLRMRATAVVQRESGQAVEIITLTLD